MEKGQPETDGCSSSLRFEIDNLKEKYKMAEKRINGRIVLKHDVESNWQLATGFTPLTGEVVIYDIDENHSYERFKIGDGVQNVNALPFVSETFVDEVTASDFDIYVQDTEPADAEEGAIWIDTANDPEFLQPVIPEVSSSVESVNGQTGIVTLDTLPTVTTADNGKVLMVVDGVWQVVTLNMSIDDNGVVSI